MHECPLSESIKKKKSIMNRHPLLLVPLLLLLLANAAVSDPFLGKWKLNVQRSNYPAGTCPKQMIIEMLAKGQAIEYRSDTTYPNGRSAHTAYIADYSGKQAMVMGTHGIMLPVSQKRVSPRVVVASYLRGFEVVATSRRVISVDGRRMTIITKSKDPAGKITTSIGSYDKEPTDPGGR